MKRNDRHDQYEWMTDRLRHAIDRSIDRVVCCFDWHTRHLIHMLHTSNRITVCRVSRLARFGKIPQGQEVICWLSKRHAEEEEQKNRKDNNMEIVHLNLALDWFIILSCLGNYHISVPSRVTLSLGSSSRLEWVAWDDGDRNDEERRKSNELIRGYLFIIK